LRPLLDLRGASAGYGGQPVLHGIDLAIRSGERIAVMGRSGAGKSTLLGLLYDHLAPEAALIPQAAALVRPLSVFHNVYMGRLDRHSTLRNLRMLAWPARAEVAAIGAVLDRVGLGEKMFARAGALSGGQQQRVSVARALYNGRRVVIGDEPVSALDRLQAADVLRCLTDRHETIILAMHDVGLALDTAERILVLEAGRLVLDAPAKDLTVAELMRFYG
jgi:phosphonate transport system ATP-binding protein